MAAVALKLRKSYAREEGEAIEIMDVGFSMGTTHFEGEGGRVVRLHGQQVESAPPFAPVDGTEFSMDADLVLLAMGFLHPQQEGVVEQLGVDLDQRGNVKAGAYASSVEGVFAAATRAAASR